jgi:polyisoprenoid-binding protein YceI
MRSWSWKRWLLVAIAGVLVVVVGGTWMYIHLIEGPAPAPLALSDASPTASSATGVTEAAAADTEGTWQIADGSLVGYRVQEVLFGQNNEAVGRTQDITGSMTVSGTTVTTAEFTVDMTTVTSDESRRDEQFNGRIMETATYPTATFELTQPIDLGSIPDAGRDRTFQATGDLTLHGVTRSVTFKVTGRWSGSVVQVAGSIPITFADWNIANPSFGGLVTTDDHGILEFALNLER